MLLMNAKLLDLSKALRDRGREHRSGNLPPTLEDGDKHMLLFKHQLHSRKGQTQLEEPKEQYKASPAWFWELRSSNHQERRMRLKRVHYFRNRGKCTPLSPRDYTAPRGFGKSQPTRSSQSRGAKIKPPDPSGPSWVSPHKAFPLSNSINIAGARSLGHKSTSC